MALDLVRYFEQFRGDVTAPLWCGYVLYVKDKPAYAGVAGGLNEWAAGHKNRFTGVYPSALQASEAADAELARVQKQEQQRGYLIGIGRNPVSVSYWPENDNWTAVFPCQDADEVERIRSDIQADGRYACSVTWLADGRVTVALRENESKPTP